MDFKDQRVQMRMTFGEVDFLDSISKSGHYCLSNRTKVVEACIQLARYAGRKLGDEVVSTFFNSAPWEVRKLMDAAAAVYEKKNGKA